jgi:hypothetical protein
VKKVKIGGEDRNRTGDRAFAEPCLTTWLPRRGKRDVRQPPDASQ